eukprot:gene4154-2996_t
MPALVGVFQQVPSVALRAHIVEDEGKNRRMCRPLAGGGCFQILFDIIRSVLLAARNPRWALAVSRVVCDISPCSVLLPNDHREAAGLYRSVAAQHPLSLSFMHGIANYGVVTVSPGAAARWSGLRLCHPQRLTPLGHAARRWRSCGPEPTAECTQQRRASRWYARQKRHGVLLPKDLPDLVYQAMVATPTPAGGAAVLAGSIAVGAAAHCSSTVDLTPSFLREAFTRLPLQAQEELAAFFLRVGTVPHGLSADDVLQLVLNAPRGAIIPQLLKTALLADPAALARVDQRHLLRCFELGLDASAADVGAPLRCMDGVSSGHQKRWIAWGEVYIPDRRRLTAALRRAGLQFEALAYSDDSGGAVPEVPRDLASNAGGGFGPEVVGMLAQREIRLPLLRRLCSEMPPALRQYASLACLLSWLRRQAGGPDYLATAALRHPGNVAGYFVSAGYFSVPELLRTAHFTLDQGTRHTARRLLPTCRTRGGIAAVMSTTRDAGVRLALDATARWRDLFPQDPAHLLLHLRRPGRHSPRHVLALELIHTDAAEDETADPPAENRSTPGAPATLSVAAFAATAAAGAALTRALRRPADANGPPLSTMSAALRSDVVSWTMQRLVQQGNLEDALSVLAIAQQRATLPETRVLVDLLLAERHGGPQAWTAQVAEWYQQHLPQAAPCVFRAAVQHASQQAGAPTLWRLLRVLAAQGFLFVPPGLRYDTAAERQQLQGVLRIALQHGSGEGGRMRVPLHAARHLLHAAEALGLRVTLDVVAGCEMVHWWSSAGRPGSRAITERLYSTAATPLWEGAVHAAVVPPPPPLAGDAALERWRLRLHKAVRLAAVGCHNTATLFTALEAAQQYLRQEEEAAPSATVPGPTPWRRRRDAALIRTVLSIAEVLRARGEGDAVRRLLPHAEELPACLQQARQRCQQEGADKLHGSAAADPEASGMCLTPLLRRRAEARRGPGDASCAPATPSTDL